MAFTQLAKKLTSILQLSTYSNGLRWLRSGKEQYLCNMIIDTDAGFDDFIAMELLKNRSVQFISIVPGIQDQPSRATNFFQKQFPQATVMTSSKKGEPAGEGWLIEYRENLNRFMEGEAKTNDNNDVEHSDSTAMIQEFLSMQPDSDPIDLMCLGPLTNIAQWVTDDKVGVLLQQKVKNVWIMGGNIPSKTSTDEPKIEPEFNFALDPIAANKVFTSPYIADKIVVLPAQTCTDVAPDNEIWKRIMHLSQSRNGIISRILKVEKDYGHIKYDPLCSYAYTHPNNIKCERLNVEVDCSNGLVSFKEDSNNKVIKFVTHADHYGDDGFLSWVCKAVEAEPLEN